MIWDLLWTPFDDRFRMLLDHLQYHKDLVTTELLIVNAKASKERDAALENSRKLADQERAFAQRDREELARLATLTDNMKEDKERRAKGQ